MVTDLGNFKIIYFCMEYRILPLPLTMEHFADLCKLPSEVGPCDGFNPSWYYNYDEKKCKQFIYGGCDGNANRFETQTECQQRCGEGTLRKHAYVYYNYIVYINTVTFTSVKNDNFQLKLFKYFLIFAKKYIVGTR